MQSWHVVVHLNEAGHSLPHHRFISRARTPAFAGRDSLTLGLIDIGLARSLT